MTQKQVQLEEQEQLFVSLLQGYGTIRKWANTIVQQHGVSLTEYHALRIIQRADYATATVLRQKLSATAPTVAQLVQHLEQKQLIKRVQDTQDKRKQHITLTEQGVSTVSHTRMQITKATNALQLPKNAIVNTINTISLITNILSSHEA